LYSSQELQMQFLQIFHKSEYLVQFLPDSDTQKMIMSYQKIFLVYRSQWYSNGVNNLFEKGVAYHKKTIDFLVDLLCDGWDGSNEINSNELLIAESETTNSTSEKKFGYRLKHYGSLEESSIDGMVSHNICTKR